MKNGCVKKEREKNIAVLMFIFTRNKAAIGRLKQCMNLIASCNF